MVSVSPIESDSDIGGDRTLAISSEESDSRTRLVSHSSRADGDWPIDIESGSVAGSPEFVILDKVKQEPGLVPSLLYPPMAMHKGDPSGWRQVSGIST